MSGIYLHIPFCKQACHYCDFHFSTSLKKKDDLLKALVAELILRNNEIKSPIETIYFGGGTPSLLSIDELNLLLITIRTHFKVIDNPEVTLEANPDDLVDDTSIFEQYKQIGINRLSIGVQSFFEEDLTYMNRAHNANEALNCIQQARKYFDNITIDLIYGVPTSNIEKWNKNLEIAFDLGINHISSYALTVEPKTVLANFIEKGTYQEPKEEEAHEQFESLVQKTKENGFIHYETSNFGKENYFSKHNTAYWLGKSYIGIGPSAHSYNGKERKWNVSNNAKYIKSIRNNSLPLEVEVLSKENRYNEYVMIGLRTIYGISLEYINNTFGEDYYSHIKGKLNLYLEKDLLKKENGVITATNKGKFLIDGIAAELFY